MSAVFQREGSDTAIFFNALYPDGIPEEVDLEIRRLPSKGQMWCATTEEAVVAVEHPKENEYFGVCLRSGQTGDKDHAAFIPCLWVDVDWKNFDGDEQAALAAIDSFEHSPSIIIRSGNGFHCYWLFRELEEIDDSNRMRLPGLLKGVAKAIGGDTACHDLARVMRVPGTSHAKNAEGAAVKIADCPNPKPVEIAHLDSDCRYNPSDFESYYAGVSVGENSVTVDLEEIPNELPKRFTECLASFANHELKGAWEGMRKPPNDTSRSGFDAMLGGMLVAQAFTDKEIAAVLQQYPHGKGSDATKPYLECTIANARDWCERQASVNDDTGQYRIENGRMGYVKLVGRGDGAQEVFVPLCNFTAEVIEEKTLDDGAEAVKRFKIKGKLASGQPLATVEVPATQFNIFNWPMAYWGMKVVLSAGQAVKDKLREAMQILSRNVKETFSFSHTGWRKIDGQWIYLHAGRKDVDVALETPLDRYCLPTEPTHIKQAIRRSYDLLAIGPDTVTIPLLASMYLAPLCTFLKFVFCVFLVGHTGSLKSTLAALFLSHFGQFDETNLPASWESTDNALERQLFLAKDVPLVVDDYAPKSDVAAQRKMEGRAQRVIRGQGNGSSRARLNADLSARPSYTPRGLLVSTGEDTPPGQSIMARTLTVDVDRSELDLKELTTAQQQAKNLPHAMAAYTDWLQPQLDTLPDELKQRRGRLRQEFLGTTTHLRIPEILANLTLGIELFCTFAQAHDALTDAEVQDLRQCTKQALQTLGEAHGRRVLQEDPADVFLKTLAAMLAQGTAHLQAAMGAESTVISTIGWRDDEYAYLIPYAARQAVAKYIRDGSGHFACSKQTLAKALLKRQALLPGAKNRTTVTKRLRGKPRRVWQMPIHFIEPTEDKDQEV